MKKKERKKERKWRDDCREFGSMAGASLANKDHILRCLRRGSRCLIFPTLSHGVHVITINQLQQPNPLPVLSDVNPLLRNPAL